jgi:(p)ppGpp synthase/HD superfamily hydrolase
MQYHYETIRRFNSEPYCNHPIAVARAVKDFGLKYETVALLHDIIEDTEMTEELLRKYPFTEDIIQAVIAITHFNSESHDEYITRCNKNKIARIVKIADMLHNIKDFHIHGKEDKICRLTKQILYIAKTTPASD